VEKEKKKEAQLLKCHYDAPLYSTASHSSLKPGNMIRSEKVEAVSSQLGWETT
jgi:hypothetical protein